MAGSAALYQPGLGVPDLVVPPGVGLGGGGGGSGEAPAGRSDRGPTKHGGKPGPAPRGSRSAARGDAGTAASPAGAARLAPPGAHPGGPGDWAGNAGVRQSFGIGGGGGGATMVTVSGSPVLLSPSSYSTEIAGPGAPPKPPAADPSDPGGSRGDDATKPADCECCECKCECRPPSPESRYCSTVFSIGGAGRGVALSSPPALAGGVVLASAIGSGAMSSPGVGSSSSGSQFTPAVSAQPVALAGLNAPGSAGAAALLTASPTPIPGTAATTLPVGGSGTSGDAHGGQAAGPWLPQPLVTPDPNPEDPPADGKRSTDTDPPKPVLLPGPKLVATLIPLSEKQRKAQERKDRKYKRQQEQRERKTEGDKDKANRKKTKGKTDEEGPPTTPAAAARARRPRAPRRPSSPPGTRDSRRGPIAVRTPARAGPPGRPSCRSARTPTRGSTRSPPRTPRTTRCPGARPPARSPPPRSGSWPRPPRSAAASS